MNSEDNSATTPVVQQDSPASKPNPVKRLYQWVLRWAETKYGLPALAVLAFVESSFFPIPPDVLLIALCMGAPKRAFKFVFWCSVSSVAGGVAGYYIGYALYEEIGRKIIEFFQYQDVYANVGKLYGENAFWSIVTAGFTPIPYKVFTIAAGAYHQYVSVSTLVLASCVGRTGRFLLVGGAIYFFGPPVKRILDKYLEWFCLAFMTLLIGSFFLIKYLATPAPVVP
ncbi:MAG: DedA family protein [Puniceicoccales bacterium]|jgi:membrane protein YqaA with SNARE-associated domain|nr:DedA family protein [Puniceicoccales bacterium]